MTRRLTPGERIVTHPCPECDWRGEAKKPIYEGEFPDPTQIAVRYECDCGCRFDVLEDGGSVELVEHSDDIEQLIAEDLHRLNEHEHTRGIETPYWVPSFDESTREVGDDQ